MPGHWPGGHLRLTFLAPAPAPTKYATCLRLCCYMSVNPSHNCKRHWQLYPVCAFSASSTNVIFSSVDTDAVADEGLSDINMAWRCSSSLNPGCAVNLPPGRATYASFSIDAGQHLGQVTASQLAAKLPS